MRIEEKLLVALPNIKADVFHKSVVYLHQYDSEGAIGFILNKKYPTSKSKIIANQLNIPDWNKIYYGGPVQTTSGFVLHSADYHGDTTNRLYDDVYFTPGNHILTDLQQGHGPERFMIVLGHAGWGAGQLAAELSGQYPYKGSNWVITEPTPEYFYGQMDTVSAWDKAIRHAAKETSNFLLDI